MTSRRWWTLPGLLLAGWLAGAPAAAAAPGEAAWEHNNRREVFFYSVGWDKGAHPNTETGKTVEPLPFHGMKSYPYTYPERYPWTPGLLEPERQFRTRWIPRD